MLAVSLYRFSPCGGVRHHFYIRLVTEDRSETFTNKMMIISDQDLDGNFHVHMAPPLRASYRSVNRNCDAHFCPYPWPAPDAEPRTNVFGAVSHSAKTPVGIPRLLNHVGIHPATVVTDEQAQ